MKKIEPSKVRVEFRDYVTPQSPRLGRKYTMTHSDETGEMFVTIGKKYATDKIGSLRDEALMGIEMTENGIAIFGEVLVDGEGIQGNSKMRDEIFARELSTALQAIRYAEQKLYQKTPRLDEIPIYIQFRSENPEYNKLYDYGTMSEYR